mgnify:CR=1 FL=1
MKNFEKITDFAHHNIYLDYSKLTANLVKRSPDGISTQEMKFKSLQSLYDYSKTLILEGYSIVF